MPPKGKKEKASGEAKQGKPSKKAKSEAVPVEEAPFDVADYIGEVKEMNMDVLRIDSDLSHGQVLGGRMGGSFLCSPCFCCFDAMLLCVHMFDP